MKNNKSFLFLMGGIVCLFLITFSITCRVFESDFAEATIDWFSFLAGIFLAAEGTTKIVKERKTANLANQCSRLFRVIIGTCVFTIHLLQFMRKI